MQKLVLEKKIESISLDGETFGMPLAFRFSHNTVADLCDRMVTRSLILFFVCIRYIPMRPTQMPELDYITLCYQIP